MSKFELIDELPPSPRVRPELIAEFTLELLENPGKWAKWPTTIARNSVSSYALRIRKGQYREISRGFQDGKFDARTVNGELYVQALP